MALPISQPVWDTLPLIRFVQFPWRFVGRAILPMALLAGAATYGVVRVAYSVIRNPRVLLVTRYSLLILFTLPVLLSVTPLLYPRICAGAAALSITDVFAYERATGNIGVDPLGAYLPVTVKERPIGSPLEEQYATDAIIQRLDRSTLPAGTQIAVERYGPNRAEIELDAPQTFRATYLTFDFPGWSITIDGQPVPIVPSEPNGLITFEVPAGQHRITVSFEDTPSRTLANVISLAALIVFGIVVVLWNKMRAIQNRVSRAEADRRPVPTGQIASTQMDAQQARIQFASPWPSWSYLTVPLVFLLLKLLLIDPQTHAAAANAVAERRIERRGPGGAR